MRVNIMFLTWNRMEYCKKSLTTYLSGHAGSIPHTLIIADNGSTDGTREYLQDLEKSVKGDYPHIDMRFRYYRKNYGKPRIVNHLFRSGADDTEYFGLICDDVVADAGWLDILVKSMDTFQDIGILGINDGRDWGPVTEKDGFGAYYGDGFFFNDDCYVMRRDVINELAKLDRETFDHHVSSGYVLMNVWGLSEGRYYSDIKGTKYKIAVTKNKMKVNISGESSDNSVVRHNILVRRFFCQNTPKYWEATGGLLSWTEGGKEYSFPEEPEDEIRCKNFPDDSFTPLSELDQFAKSQSYANVFSDAELKFWEK